MEIPEPDETRRDASDHVPDVPDVGFTDTSSSSSLPAESGEGPDTDNVSIYADGDYTEAGPPPEGAGAGADASPKPTEAEKPEEAQRHNETSGEVAAAPQDGHEALRAAIAAGKKFHEMPRAATEFIAEHLDLRTTTSPEDPGSFDDFHKAKNRERVYDTIADRVTAALGKTAEFRDAVREGRLKQELKETLRATHLSTKEVYVADPQHNEEGELVDGTVTAESMTLTVGSPEQARKLAVLWQVIPRSRNIIYPVFTDPGDEDRPATVEVGNVNEHTIRGMGRDISAVIDRLDRTERGWRLPSEKRTLEQHKNSGKTFDPEHEAELAQVNEEYHELTTEATYRDDPDLEMPELPDPDYDILASDPAAWLQAARETFNKVIHEMRGGSHRNLEQPRNPADRFEIEEDLDLLRDPVDITDPEQLEALSQGPPEDRTPTAFEQGLEKGRKGVEGFKEDPYAATYKGAVSAAALALGGLSDLALKGAALVPAATRQGRQLNADFQEWRETKAIAEANEKRIRFFSAWYGR